MWGIIRRSSVGAGSILAITGCLAGCDATEASEADDASLTETIADGSRDALAMLAFLNDLDTGEPALKDAGLTSASRKATMTYRVGADGALGSRDDRGFSSVADVDAISGIGPATIKKLAARAVALGYAPERGEYAGVYFTERQARQTLDLVSTATEAELDVDASLDVRAARAIVAARPIASMAKLASVSRVKATALQLLRDHAERTRGPALCDATLRCATGLFCTGGSSEPGRCVNTNVPGKGDPCSGAGQCREGLVCGGRTPSFEGICSPAWMHDEFVSEGATGIPDAPNEGAGQGLTVVGLASVPTDAIVRVRLDHARPADLDLSLINPTGTSVSVWAAGTGAPPESMPVGVPGDESVNGDWVLWARDTRSGEAGAITRWSLELTSRFD